MNTPEILLEIATHADLPEWIDTKRACYKSYVDQYYGGWVEDVQARMNTATFEKALCMTYFRKITLDGSTVGFLGYDEQTDRIAGITVHMYEHARNQGIGSRFLAQITERSRTAGKPAYLKVFKTNPARRLYERFGFQVYDETESHFLMKYEQHNV